MLTARGLLYFHTNVRERVTIERLDRGVRGTKKTLDRMHKLVELGKLDPTIQRIATWIRLGVPKDRRASTKAVIDRIFWWVKKHGVFQRDPFQIEKIEHPIVAMRPIIEARQAGTYKGPGLFVGDCDTIAGVYLASLLGALGFQYAWETAKVDPQRPDEFSHVWVAVRVNGDWYPLDPSTESATPGWRPPVAPELFARWPERPIEDVVGDSMSGLNGSHRGSLGHGEDVTDGENAYYPAEEYGYGIPKSFGPDGAEGFIPVSDAANMQLLPPHDTEIPAAHLQPGFKYIKASNGKNPSHRIVSLTRQPDDHGPPYYRRRPTRQPYEKIENQPYPPGSRWNEHFGHDVRRFRKAGPYIQEQQPGTPERQVHIVMEQPMAIRRRVIVMEQPTRVPAGMGEDEDWKATLVTSLDSEPAKAVTAAGNSVLDTVAKTIAEKAKIAGTVATAKIENKYAAAVAKATNKVAGAPVAQVKMTPVSKSIGSTSILSSPWVWVGTGLTAAAAGYVLLKSRGRSRRRRR